MPASRRAAALAETDQGSPGAGACEPDGIRELPQCDAESGEQVGARREEAIWPGTQTPIVSRATGHCGCRLTLRDRKPCVCRSPGSFSVTPVFSKQSDTEDGSEAF